MATRYDVIIPTSADVVSGPTRVAIRK